MGLTSTGFVSKRADEIRADLVTAVKQPAPDGLGAGCSTGDDSPIGALVGVMAIAMSLVWEGMQELYDAFSPDAASGASLDNLCALTGVRRKGALPSSGTVTFTGVSGTVVPSGTLVRVPSGPIFATLESVTIEGGETTVDADVECVVDGPVEAAAGTVSAMVSLIADISAVTNAADMAVGRNIEADDDLRARREASLSVAGSGPDAAIRTALLQVDEVIDAIVISNRSLFTDADGIPGKAFRAIVWSGSTPLASDDEVLQTIWEKMPAGIYPDGTVVGTITDAQGYEQTVRFSRAVEKPVYLVVHLTVDASYPYGGDDLVAAALLAEGQGFGIGQDVILIRFVVAAFEAAPGIVGITVQAGFSPDPSGSVLLTIALDEIATFDAANIVVAVVT